jgi:hypothetical protein
MAKCFWGAAVSTIGLFAACSSAPKTPIVALDAPAETSSAKPIQRVAPPTTEPVAIAPTRIEEPPPPDEPINEHPVEYANEGDGLVEGGVVGGVVGDAPGHGVLGGVAGGVVGGSPSSLPADGVYRMGDPRLTQTRCPRQDGPPYPQAAKDANVETTIIARCIVETNGALDCKLVKSHPLFEKSMLDHLKKTRVPPMTTTDGKPARVLCNFVYRFRMD